MPTVVVKTVKPSGGDYTSLAAAEAGEQRDLVAADQIAAIECYSMLDTSRATISGWVTDPAHYAHIYTPHSERHPGRRDSTKYRLETSGGSNNSALAINQSYTRVEGVQAKNFGGGSSNSGFTGSTGIVGVVVSDCLAYDCNGAGFPMTGDYTLLNCIAVGCLTGFGHSSNSGSMWLYNCIAVNNTGIGFIGDTRFGARFTYCKNCYAGGNGGVDYDNTNGFSTLTTCYSEDGTAGTAVAAFSVANFTNVTPGAEDLSLTGSSTLIDAGTDLSTDPNWLDPDGAVDIIGTVRPQGTAWDVGPFEYVSAATGYTLDCGPGSYTVTGTPAAPLAGRSLAATPGAYTVAGTDTATLADRLLAATPAAYTITGDPADLAYTQLGAYVLDAQSGTYTVDGAAAGTHADRSLGLAPAGYTLTGEPAATHADRALTATPGVFTLDGAAAAAHTARLLATTPGGYTVTGATALLEDVGHLAPAPVTTRTRTSPATGRTTVTGGGRTTTTLGGD